VNRFDGATGYLSSESVETSQCSPAYSEVPNMNDLARLLLASRTDLVVLDYNIFIT